MGASSGGDAKSAATTLRSQRDLPDDDRLALDRGSRAGQRSRHPGGQEIQRAVFALEHFDIPALELFTAGENADKCCGVRIKSRWPIGFSSQELVNRCR